MPDGTCAQCKSRESCENVFHFRKKGIPLNNAWCHAWEPEKRPTNGDRIRTMNDDQLVYHLFAGCNQCAFKWQGEGCGSANCHEGLLQWLKQEETE